MQQICYKERSLRGGRGVRAVKGLRQTTGHVNILEQSHSGREGGVEEGCIEGQKEGTKDQPEYVGTEKIGVTGNPGTHSSCSGLWEEPSLITYVLTIWASVSSCKEI